MLDTVQKAYFFYVAQHWNNLVYCFCGWFRSGKCFYYKLTRWWIWNYSRKSSQNVDHSGTFNCDILFCAFCRIGNDARGQGLWVKIRGSLQEVQILKALRWALFILFLCKTHLVCVCLQDELDFCATFWLTLGVTNCLDLLLHKQPSYRWPSCLKKRVLQWGNFHVVRVHASPVHLLG
jgi:hypothetical protein